MDHHRLFSSQCSFCTRKLRSPYLCLVIMRIPHFLIFICSIIGLSSCSLPGTLDESGDITTNTVLFENSAVSVLVPKSWSWATVSELPSPRIGSIITAYISPEVKWGFSNNFVILKDTLDRIMTSSKYSELNNIQTTKKYLEYKKISDTNFTFSDNETSRIYVFEARYNETTSKMKFIQTARVCGSTVYLLHFTLSLDKNPDIYSKLLESFTCK